MRRPILALNAGSATVKYALFEDGEAAVLRLVKRGVIEGPPGPETLARVLDAVEERLEGLAPDAVGHRIVHGGARFAGPVVLDEAVLAELDALRPLAPLHQGPGLEMARAAARLWPDAVQVASFDTAFHHGHAPVFDRLALPRALEAEGVRRYGFHGLSYAHLAERLAQLDPPLARGRVVAAHLGAGASLCAMIAGRSVDSTMGFSALDGLVMGTRCGTLDPGVVLHLIQQRGLSAEAVSDLLYRRSGLLGVSGISADVRELLASPAHAAREALELFAHRAAQQVCAMASSLGGIDGLVFTGGVGENAAPVRAMICERLEWLGARLDPAAEAGRADRRLSAPGAALRIWVVAADEERVIAREAAGEAGPAS